MAKIIKLGYVEVDFKSFSDRSSILLSSNTIPNNSIVLVITNCKERSFIIMDETRLQRFEELTKKFLLMKVSKTKKDTFNLVDAAHSCTKEAEISAKLLGNPYEKNQNATPIQLGAHLIVSGTRIGEILLNLKDPDIKPEILLQYFNSVLSLLQSTKKLVMANRDNLGNPKVMKHMKNTLNSILVESGALFVVNKFLDKNYLEEVGSSITSEDDNTDPPNGPSAA